jgi:hypothetical protein
VLQSLGFPVHISYAANNHYSQYNKADFAFTFILAHKPDKKYNKRYYKNRVEDDGWKGHFSY